jgi:hypothetical protein
MVNIRLVLIITLFLGVPSGDDSVQSSKKVLILGTTMLPFLDSCHQLGQITVIPSDRCHVLANLLLGAKIRVCFRSCFKIGNADILAAIPLQGTG